MNAASLMLLVSTFASPVDDDSAAMEFEYIGQLEQVARGADAQAVNRFRIYCLVKQLSNGRHQVDYLIREQGSDGWRWPERFGRLTLGSGYQRLDGRPLRLMHRFQDNDYPITVPLPLFDQFSRMKSSAEWQDGQKSFVRGAQSSDKGRSLRTVEVFSRVGRSQELTVDERTGVLIRADQKVFMGQGDEFRLTLELESSQGLTAQRSEQIQGAFNPLLELQASLKRSDGQTRRDFTADQIALVQQKLQILKDASAETPLQAFVATLTRDTASQSLREESIEQLAQKFIGKAAPDFELTDLRMSPVPAEQLQGRITVLHFWNYQFEPLEEPYGQVGYLDYLHSRRSKLGVQFYGVAVNSAFGQPERSRAAVRSVRKLQEFMNLSYDVTLDAGALLRKFGDPRRLDAELPLWVVIDSEGKVAMYKAGLFPLKPDEGLRELDQVLIKLIREQRIKQRETDKLSN